MDQQEANLREALRLAQETMDKCQAFIGESNDDSCRAIYSGIRDLMSQQKGALEKELDAHEELYGL
ncbi:MAG: hypothetical protein ACYC4L_00945 [Chloroflexota bacterium]